MTPDLPQLRRSRWIACRAALLAVSAAVIMLPAGTAQAAVSPAAAAYPVAATKPAAVTGLAAVNQGPAGPSDNGFRSFGVQPSGPKKPDPRPNFTYRNVAPGQRLNDFVAFVNISAQPVTLKVYAADGYNTPTGAFDLLTASKRSTDIGSWVKLRRTQVTVPPQKAFITPIQIRIPRNAEPGDHAGGIVASFRTTARDKKGNTVVVDERVGTRMYVRVTGKLRPHVVLNQERAVYHSSNLFSRGDAQVTYTIKNDGNVRLVGTPTIRVSDMFGGSTQAVGVPDMPELLPGYSFTFTTKVAKVRPALMLTAHVVIDPRSVTGNVDPALEQVSVSLKFWAFYWPFAGLLLLVIAGAGVYWWRRRRGSAGPASGPGRGASPRPDPHPRDSESERTPEGVMSRRSSAPEARRALTRLRLLALTGLMVAALPVLPIVGANPAQAASDPGGLTFLPGKGMDISPLYVVTSAGCPTEAPNLIGRMYGKGFPKDGIVVIPNGDASIVYGAPFGVPLQDTIAGFASDLGVKLKGKYTITVQCINRFGTKVFASFSGVMTFTKATSFSAPVPKNPPAEGVPMGALAQVFKEFKLGSPSAAAAGTTPGQTTGPSVAQGTTQEAAIGTGSSASDGTSNLAPFLIIGGGALILGGGGFLATRRKALPAGPKPEAATTEWPDDEKPVASDTGSSVLTATKVTTSTKPVTATKPATSTEPVTATEPATSTEPVTATEPATSAEPVTAAEPVISTQPVMTKETP